MVSVPVVVEVEPPMAGRGDVPVRAWIGQFVPDSYFIDGTYYDAVQVSVELRNGQRLETGFGTGHFLTGKELEEIARL